MEHITNQLRQLTDTEKEGLQLQESKVSVNSDEKSFIKSLKTPQIIQRPLEELKEVLRYAMMKVGLREINIPADIEKQVLIEHIVTHYGSHTHEEIKLAFDLAITGKLDVDPNCFENFSCVYVSKILNAYRSWATKTYKAVVKEKHPDPEIETLTDKTMQEMWNDVSLKVKSGLPYFSIYPTLYEWANERGMIKNSGLKKADFFQLAVQKKIDELTEMYKNDKSSEIKKQLEDYIRMKTFSIVEAYYVPTVRMNSKQLMVQQMMLNENTESDSDRTGSVSREDMGGQ